MKLSRGENYSQCAAEKLIECDVEKDLVIVTHKPVKQVCLCIRNSAIASWEISHVSAEDEGLYECIAQSTAGQGRALTQLTVKGTFTTLKTKLASTVFLSILTEKKAPDRFFKIHFNG